MATYAGQMMNASSTQRERDDAHAIARSVSSDLGKEIPGDPISLMALIFHYRFQEENRTQPRIINIFFLHDSKSFFGEGRQEGGSSYVITMIVFLVQRTKFTIWRRTTWSTRIAQKALI